MTNPLTEPRPSAERDRQFAIALGVIALVGMVARIAYVIWLRDRAVPFDGLRFHFRARALADLQGFVNPLQQQLTGAAEAPPDASNPPAWPLLLAGPSFVGLRSVLAHQLIACVVGAGTIVMSGLAGRAAFSRRTGVIAAAIVAAYPNIWLYERELLAESLTLFGVALCLWLAYRFYAAPSLLLAVALGASVGLLAMTRAEQIALVPLLLVPLVLSARTITWPRRFGWLAIAGVACFGLIAPWAVYNTSRFEHPVFLSTGLGAALRSGNCEGTYSGPLLGYYDDTSVECAFVRPAFAGDASVVESELRKLALEYMNDNRDRVPAVAAARIGRTFSVFRPFQQVDLEAKRFSPTWVIGLGLFSFWALVPVAVAGAVFARRRGIPIYPMLAFPAAIILSVAFTIGAVRYRAPAEIPLALLAAFAIDVLTRRRLRSKSSSNAGTAVGSTHAEELLSH